MGTEDRTARARVVISRTNGNTDDEFEDEFGDEMEPSTPVAIGTGTGVALAGIWVGCMAALITELILTFLFLTGDFAAKNIWSAEVSTDSWGFWDYVLCIFAGFAIISFYTWPLGTAMQLTKRLTGR
jgi:hypothetical protein